MLEARAGIGGLEAHSSRRFCAGGRHPAGRGARRRGQFLQLRERIDLLGQTALAARGGVLVDHADLRGLVELLHRVREIAFAIRCAGGGRHALGRGLHRSAHGLVGDAGLLVRTDALLGLFAGGHAGCGAQAARFSVVR